MFGSNWLIQPLSFEFKLRYKHLYFRSNDNNYYNHNNNNNDDDDNNDHHSDYNKLVNKIAASLLSANCLTCLYIKVY